jgi:hypothetical protein
MIMADLRGDGDRPDPAGMMREFGNVKAGESG